MRGKRRNFKGWPTRKGILDGEKRTNGTELKKTKDSKGA
jgi:hypothetical protein